MYGYVRFETISGGEYLTEARDLKMEFTVTDDGPIYEVCGKMVTALTYNKLLERMREAKLLVWDLVGEGVDTTKAPALVR
jgi:hypothetical protein